MQTTSIERKILFAILAIVLILTLLIFYPFLTTIILAISFSVILNPVYLWIKKYIKNAGASAFVTLFLFLVILCIPLFFIGNSILQQSTHLYTNLIENDNTNNLISSVNKSINDIMPSGYTFDIYNKITNLLKAFWMNLKVNFFKKS